MLGFFSGCPESGHLGVRSPDSLPSGLRTVNCTYPFDLTVQISGDAYVTLLAYRLRLALLSPLPSFAEAAIAPLATASCWPQASIRLCSPYDRVAQSLTACHVGLKRFLVLPGLRAVTRQRSRLGSASSCMRQCRSPRAQGTQRGASRKW